MAKLLLALLAVALSKANDHSLMHVRKARSAVSLVAALLFLLAPQTIRSQPPLGGFFITSGPLPNSF
jgi:hypothetical protein